LKWTEETGGSFEKLEVWQRSVTLAARVYKLLENCRDFGLRDQMTRAVNSISSNIAEGAERPGKAEFKLFLGYAKGSAGEVRSQSYIAESLGYIRSAEARDLRQELKEISRMLFGLIQSLDR